MPKPIISLKVSKHPVKPDTFLVSPYITVLHQCELPPKDVVFVLDTSGSMQGPRIDKVKPATLNLINELIPGKDFFSVVKFDSNANCIVTRRQVKKNDSEVEVLINNLKADNSTNVEQGLNVALTQITKGNLENTTIILLSDGEATDGEKDPKKLITLLKRGLDDNPVRVIPIGIGTGYIVDFMRKLGLETGFRGLIHLDDNANPQTAFTQVKPYLLPRTKPLTVSVSFGGSTLNEELGSIECNSPASSVFEFVLPPGKQLQDIEIKCTTKMGKEENNFVSKNNVAEFNTEIIARYYTQKYLNILEQNERSYEQINKLTPLLAEITHFNHHAQIKIVRDKVEQTINSLRINDVSVTRTNYTSMYTGYTRVAGAGTRTQISQRELVNVVGYDQVTNTLHFNGVPFKALNEDIDLNDVKTNGQHFVSFDAAIQNREAIIFSTEDIYRHKYFAKELVAEVGHAGFLPLHNRLEVLCAAVRKQFNATNVDEHVRSHVLYNPAHQLKLNDGSSTIPCIPLGVFLNFGTGVCRHYAPFTAMSIIHLIRNNLLPPGTVRIYRGTADNQKAHSWVHYHPKDKMNEHLLFLIDATNQGQKVFVFDLRKIKRREKDVDLENAILNYRQRGLDGLLSEMLNKHYQLNITHIQLSENIRVSAELIQQIQSKIEIEKSVSDDKFTSKTEIELKNEGAIDPISDDIIIEPVKTDDRIDDKNKDRKHIYDRDFITAWLRNHDTSPNTGLKLLTKELRPAYDEVNRINGILARKLGILLPEQHAQSTIAVQAQPLFSEEVGLSILNSRDIQVQSAIQSFETKFKSAVTSNPSAAPQVTISGIARVDPLVRASVVPSSTSTTAYALPAAAAISTSSSASTIELVSLPQPSSAPINNWASVMPTIGSAYEQQCGFFHWRSKESLKLLEDTAEGTVFDESYSQNASRRQTLITKYLSDSNNKGKRLYDILLEQKIKFDQSREGNRNNLVWLNNEILYLIENKYFKQRGFKLFGRTCETSSVLLNYLKESNSLSQKQQAIDNYLNDVNYLGVKVNQGKRLFIILNEMKEKFARGADQDLSRRNDL